MVAVVAALTCAGTAQAQYTGAKLIQGPEYGTVREVLGMPLLVAQPKPNCPTAARLAQDGPCFDTVTAYMRARGVTSATVFGASQQVSAGATIGGEPGSGFDIFTVTAAGGQFSATRQDDVTTSVRVPRECFSLPGEGVKYSVESRDGQTVAQERQLVVCGGGPQGNGPYQPAGPSIPASPPAINQAPMASGQTWEVAGYRSAVGTTRHLAAPSPTCSATGVLRDGICFDAAIALMNADQSLRELDVVAARRPVSGGESLSAAETEQYVLKRRRNGYKADKRWSDRTTVSGPSGCSAVSPVRFHVTGPASVQERQRLLCGAPAAPAPMAIYEVYGKVEPIIEPGSCAPEQRLLGGGMCSSNVIGYMRAHGIGSMQAIVIGRALVVGSRVHKSGSQISLDFAQVRANPDGQTFSADRQLRYENGITIPSGCRILTSGPSEREGVIVVGGGWRMAQHYQWVQCPTQ